jgi:hypothetical protein
LKVDDALVVHDNAKAQAVYENFNDILGTPANTLSLDFQRLGILVADLTGTDFCFSEEEVWRVIQDMSLDKAPGPDGFTRLFYRTAWPIIKQDIM